MSGFGHFPAGIGAAVLIAFLISGFSALIARRNPTGGRPGWGIALGVGLAYLAGHAFVHEWVQAARFEDLRKAFQVWDGQASGFPLFPGDAVDWLPWVAGLAMVCGLLDSTWPAPRWTRWENGLLLVSLTLWLILSPLFGGTWEPLQGLRWMLGLGVGMMAFWRLLEARAGTLGRSMPLVLMLISTALSLCLALSGSLLYGGLGGVVAAMCGGLWWVSWFDRGMSLARPAIPNFVVVFAGLTLCGVFYSELPRASAVILAIAPLVTFVDRLPVVTRLGGWKASAIRSVVLLLPLAGAVAWTFSSRPEETTYDSYGVATPDALGTLVTTGR